MVSEMKQIVLYFFLMLHLFTFASVNLNGHACFGWKKYPSGLYKNYRTIGMLLLIVNSCVH